MTIHNVPNQEDDFDGNPVEPDQDDTQKEVPNSEINPDNPDLNDDDHIDNESIPSEILEDEVPDIDKTEHKFPSDDSNIGDDPIYPNKDDIIPKNDRIPAKIRNDDNPANVSI